MLRVPKRDTLYLGEKMKKIFHKWESRMDLKEGGVENTKKGSIEERKGEKPKSHMIWTL